MQKDGVINTSIGTDVFIIKDLKNGLNNCNSFCVSKEDWDILYVRNNIGYGYYSEDDNTISVEFLDEFKGELDKIEISKTSTVTPNKYNVSVRNDGLGDCIVTAIDNVIHFIAPRRKQDEDGNPIYDRYIVDLKSPVEVGEGDEKKSAYVVERIQFNSIGGNTVDFSTKYDFDQLRENLFSNIKSFMLNEMLSNILENASDGFHTIDLNKDIGYLDLYLNLFTDTESLANYNLV